MAERDWYFGWFEDEDEAFDPEVHARHDIPFSSVEFSEAEETDAVICALSRDAVDSGSYAGRSWAFLSWHHPDGTIIPMLNDELLHDVPSLFFSVIV